MKNYVGTPKRRETAQEIAIKAIKRHCKYGLFGEKYLRVMVETISTYDDTDMGGYKGRVRRVACPYKHTEMYALITICDKSHAYIQDLSCNGNLINLRPIPCNGSVTRASIMDAIGVHDTCSTRVYACKVRV